ncbi:MarR family transcriptional regulator [Clostridiaceae bacterium 35-E11]
MANYYHEINKMMEKLIHKILVQDRKGFKLDERGVELSFLDMDVIRKIGEVEDKKIYELIEEMEMDRSFVASITKKLMLGGYIVKEKSHQDKRVYILRLTEEGKKIYKKSLEKQSVFIDFILSEITLNEEKAILKFLSKINQTTLLQHWDKGDAKK